MKKQASKTILSSAVSIALSAVLIAGSTFALFTGQSDTDISITSGNVDVEATASITKVFSAEWSDGEYTDKDLYAKYDQETYEFTNGGTAKLDGKSLTLNSISPGDGVEFQIEATNSSTIAIKYQTVVTFVSGGEVDAAGEYVEGKESSALYRALEVTVGNDGGKEYIKDPTSTKSTASSAWTEVEKAEGEIAPITVSIRFPMQDSTLDYDKLQSMGCVLRIGLYAVQANGNDTTNQDVYLVTEDSNLSEVFDEAQSGDTVVLADDITLEDEPLSVTGEKDLTLDASQHDITINNGKETVTENALTVESGSSLTFKGAPDAESEAKSKFTINVGPNATPNFGKFETSNYALFVEEGGQVNMEDVRFDVNWDDSSSFAGYVGGGEMNFGKGAEVNFNGYSINADDTIEKVESSGGGVFVADGGVVNFEDATVNSKGNVAPLYVGWAKEGKKSEINFKSGTTVNYSDCGDPTNGAVVVYPGGVVNVDEGATINLTGKPYTFYLDSGSVGSEVRNGTERAITLIGGGEAYIHGTINLDVDIGLALAFCVVTNYIWEDDQRVGFTLDAHVVIGSTAVITGKDETSGGGTYFFGAQRNGKQMFTAPETAEFKPMELAGETDEGQCSIIIEKGAQTILNGEQINKNSGKGNFCDQRKKVDSRLDSYTSDAIWDQRCEETAPEKYHQP